MKTFLLLFDDAVELELEVEYSGVHRPAYISGPPEDCYPDESEMTIEGYTVVSVNEIESDHPEITELAVEQAFEKAKDRIEQECWDDYFQSE